MLDLPRARFYLEAVVGIGMGYTRGVSVATDHLIDQLLLPFIHLAVKYGRVSGTGQDTPLNNKFFACFCSALDSDFGRHPARLPAIAESHTFVVR